MEIIKIDINTIKPYKNNAKMHPKEQIEQIKKSIKEFGNNDPIAIDENNVIIEGHGRYEALKELGYKEAECIRLSHLSEEQKKAYILVHNKLTMNSDFDYSILESELNEIVNIDMQNYGFLEDAIDEFEEGIDELYTKKINIPQYEINGDMPEIEDLIEETKYNEFKSEIENSNVTDEQKEFLLKALTRLYTFDYASIAEYYAHQNKEMQELMEKLALVIIDINDAIANGYVELSKSLGKMLEDE